MLIEMLHWLDSKHFCGIILWLSGAKVLKLKACGLLCQLFHLLAVTLGRNSYDFRDVGSSAPSILPPRVRLPSTPSMLLSNFIWIVICRKDENKLKEARNGPSIKLYLFNCLRLPISIFVIICVHLNVLVRVKFTLSTVQYSINQIILFVSLVS